MKHVLVPAIATIAFAPFGSYAQNQSIPDPSRWVPAVEHELRMLSEPDMQKELKLAPEQLARFAKLQVKYREERERLAGRETFKNLFELSQRTTKGLEEIIEERQTKRLRQIQTQQNWVILFVNPVTSKRMNLTEEQKKSVQAILADSRKEQRKIPVGTTDAEREQTRMKIAEQMKSVLKDVRNVLDAQQNRTLDDELGEPYQGRLPHIPVGDVEKRPMKPTEK